MKCPQCNTECEPYAEVDIGVGVMQGGPWGCPACHWIESGEITQEMMDLGAFDAMPSDNDTGDAQ